MTVTPNDYRRAVWGSCMMATTKLVCLAIAEFADNVTCRAWPSVPTIATMAGVSERAVSKHTKLAEQAGYLEKKQRANTAIMYTIVAPEGAPRVPERKRMSAQRLPTGTASTRQNLRTPAISAPDSQSETVAPALPVPNFQAMSNDELRAFLTQFPAAPPDIHFLGVDEAGRRGLDARANPIDYSLQPLAW